MDILQTEQAMVERMSDAMARGDFNLDRPFSGNEFLFIALVCIAAIFVLWKPSKN